MEVIAYSLNSEENKKYEISEFVFPYGDENVIVKLENFFGVSRKQLWVYNFAQRDFVNLKFNDNCCETKSVVFIQKEKPTISETCEILRKHYMPRVVRIRRSKGQVVQDCDIYIGRKCDWGGWNLPESKWHNPFRLSDNSSIIEVLNKYREYMKQRPDLIAALPELAGKTLGCWCKDTFENPCHGDVLVELFCAVFKIS